MSRQLTNFYVLRKLSDLHPRVIVAHPSRVHPFSADVTRAIATLHANELGESNIRTALWQYRNSRGYKRAVADGRPYVDFDGITSELPSTEEQRDAGEWLHKWSLENCLNT